MKRLILFYFLVHVNSGCVSQYWMRSFGGATIDEGLDIDHGSHDETFSTGYFSGSAVFGTATNFSNGLTDIFLVKTDSSGLVSWVNQAGGTGIDKGLSADADSSGYCVVTGFFSNTAQFGSQTVVSAGQQDVFIAKYNPGGNLVWVVTGGGANSDIGNCVKFDASGNIIVTGEFSGTSTFSGITLTSLSGTIDVFTAKYDANGNLLWIRQGSGPYTDRGIKLAVDFNGNTYVNGLFSDTITFDVAHYTTIANGKFLVSYDPAGNEKWFSWMGGSGQSDPGGMEYKNNTLTLTGSFLGNLYFFGNGPTQTLNGTNNFNIYLCRYDTSGSLLWKTTTGSANDFSSHDVTVTTNDDIIICGNFNCRLTDFSDIYGSGTFCSNGFNDCYAAGYNSTGTWQWARNFGSRENDFASAVSSGSANHISVTGSAEDTLYSTYKPGGFLGYNAGVFGGLGSYCNDPDYFKVVKLYTDTQSSDIFINSNLNLLREPLDFFNRNGTGCQRPYGEITICGSPGPCADTLVACNQILLRVDLNSPNAGPSYTYLWSDGQTTETAFFNTSGIISVMVTSKDGCFTNTDSVIIIIHPLPVKPLLSDSKGINFFTLNTLPVHICQPDSVILFSPNAGSYNVNWITFPAGQNPVTIYSSGLYSCIFTDSFGCTSLNVVQVITDLPIDPISPVMTCLEDPDKNDTISVCDSSIFSIFIFDSLSNPGGALACLPSLSYINWSCTINGIPFTNQTGCNLFGELTLLASPPGTYDYLFSATVIRINACDTDSVFILNKPLHVIVTPAPSGGILNTIISGPVEMCPGDTALLIATGGTNFLWNNNSTNDSLYTLTPGYYFVNTDSVATNSSGCSAHYYGYANFTLTQVQQPIISSNPPGAVFCINDSLQLNCTGSAGTFQWQGPTGILPDSVNSIYVSIPGIYYCIQTISPTCQVISNTLQVTQITTPSIGVLPSTIICKGDSAEIIIYADPGTPVNWYPPLFGLELHQTVYDSGTYTVEVFSCNTLYTFNITVVLDSGKSIITSIDSSFAFCEGDSLLLSGNPGMAFYSWMPSGVQSQNILITASGDVTLYTINQNGCKDSSTVFISEQQNTLVPPVALDTTLCAGDSIVVQAFCTTPVFWASSPVYSAVFNQGSFYQTPPVINPVIYYLFTDSGKCKSVFDSVSISIAPTALASITASDSTLKFCEGGFITLNANAGMNSYLWLPGNEQTISILVDTSETVSLLTTTLYGCTDSTGIIITEQLNDLQPPVANDTIVCEGESVLLTAYSNQHINWSSAMNYTGIIQTGNFFQTPLLLTPVTYYLFSDSGVCKSDFDSVSVFIDPCEEAPDTTEPFVPNIYTPNGDGLNEYFPGFKFHLIRLLQIYNRWGEDVFSAENIYNGWNGLARNGGKVPDGIYYYVLKYDLKNKKQIFRKGYFMLIR